MIHLELTIDEVNGILQSLGNMPYAQVVTLVEKIKAQAIPQVPVTQAPAVTESDPASE
jgi:hypothetical protein